MSATPSPDRALAPKTVAATLQQQVAKGALEPDAAQTRAGEALDRLHQSLIESYGNPFHASPLHASRALLNRLPFASRRERKLRGLYLWSKPGSGKSMLMDMFFRNIESSPSLSGLTRRRTHFLPFMEGMHSDIERLNKRRARDPIAALAKRVARESRLLCFDEFVVEDIADAMLLGRLFAALAEQGLILVATSNFAPDELYKDGLKRENFLPFLALLRESVVTVPVLADADYRSLALAEQGIDLWFAATQGKKRMRETFARFVETSEEGGTLACEGRAILFKRTGEPSEKLRVKGLKRKVVWCDFADLCQKPRGVRDYRVLLSVCDILFLANFPVLDETERNSAKRFMRLIDMFYERRALVLCHSPASSPKSLYQGESHAREFRRTTSRLEEMLARAHALL